MTMQSIRVAGARVAASLVTALLLLLLPVISDAIVPTSAQAQNRGVVTIKAEFRVALEPHGRFETHSKWGEIWIPAQVSRDWRPYTNGRWVHTEDWGWYWIADDSEAAWGWVAFHYGRWVYDEDRWIWIATEEWGPGWVVWRHGKEYVGWAAMPPDEVIVEYVEKPEVWVFIRVRDFTAPRYSGVLISGREREVLIRETVIVNRTVVIRDRRIAVNPGIPATFIAARIGRPLPAFQVRPRILEGTVEIEGAVRVRAEDLRRGQARSFREEVRQTQTVIRPAQNVQEPQPLAANAEGRLGDNPPRAARRGGEGQQPPGTQGQGSQDQTDQQKGAAPKGQPKQGTKGQPKDETQGQGGQQKGDQQQQRGQKGLQNGQPKDETQGLGGQQKDQPRVLQKGEAKQKGEPKQKGQPKDETQGQGGQQKSDQPRVLQKGEPKQKGQPKDETQGQGGQQKSDQQRGLRVTPKEPSTEGRGRGDQPKAAPKELPKELPKQPSTEGRGGGGDQPKGPPRAAPKELPKQPAAQDKRGEEKQKGKE